jgi:hypothetical protein
MLLTKLTLMQLAQIGGVPPQAAELIKNLDNYVTGQLIVKGIRDKASQQSYPVGNHGYQMRWLTREVDPFGRAANEFA